MIDDNGLTTHLRVHLAGHTRRAVRHDVCKSLQRQQLVVPRKLIGTRYAGARQVVVELMPDDALPTVRQTGRGIWSCSQPVGHHSRTLCGIPQMLILPIV